jgi:uncharacterized membrane protein
VDGEQVWIIVATTICGLIGWALLCHRSLLKRRVTVADLLALVLVVGVVLGICSLFGVTSAGF